MFFDLFQVSTKTALLRSMLQNSTDSNSTSITLAESTVLDTTLNCTHNNNSKNSEMKSSIEDIKLWKKSPVLTTHHKRWFSTPVEDEENQSLKVLWV